ncbi:MAG: hypothetical protein KKD00_11555 [Gammaproteobacteria bacterium]|nr:hypothetical protein [Gammaproteobacteria bacterium]
METEYKIIQSTTPHFAKADNLNRVLAEEAQAGWVLVEKFDNYKLRLQRDISHRSGDKGRSIDPYRVQVGPSNVVTYGAAALLTLMVVYAIFRMVGTF